MNPRTPTGPGPKPGAFKREISLSLTRLGDPRVCFSSLILHFVCSILKCFSMSWRWAVVFEIFLYSILVIDCRMMIRSVSIMRLELAGIVFIVFLGSFLHFTFELSGNNPVVALFSAVKECMGAFEIGFLACSIAYIYRRIRVYSKPTIFIVFYQCLTLIVFIYYLSKFFIKESLVLDIFHLHLSHRDWPAAEH